MRSWPELHPPTPRRTSPRARPLALAVLLLALGAGGCGPDPDCTDLTWDNYGQGELRSWCTGCHSSHLAEDARWGAPEGVDFDTRAGIRAHAERALARATADPPTMPPVGGGDAEARERLGEWLACGAP